jgi:23S rRNA G2445 N2-methylase RlmL
VILELIVPCAGGLEPLVRAELEALGARDPVELAGAVRAGGTWETVWRANLGLRCGRRVLVGLADWDAWNAATLRDGLIERLRADPGLRDLLRPDRSIALHGSVSASRLADGRAVAGIVRGAILAAQSSATGTESRVLPAGADVPLRVRVHRDVATLLLDTSGWPLDQRGARERADAPRATVCAALFAAAEWDGDGPLLDPFAGDGRVLEEALAACEGSAPGARRERWPFQQLRSFDPSRFRALPPPAPVAPGVALHPGDPNQRVVQALRSWATALDVADRARCRHTHLSQLTAPAVHGLLVSAPPADLPQERWEQLGEALKHRFPGWTAALLCQGGGEKRLGLRPRRTVKVRDGGMDGTIVVLDLWAGRKRG